MAVLFVINRASGTGRAGRLASVFVRACEAAGVFVGVCDARDARPGGVSREAYYARFDAVVVVGGDGTLHHLLPAVSAAGVPVYHAPAGTENLFAREFGMTREPGDLLRALEQRRMRRVDLATIDGTPFSLMVSFGPDAGVIHRLDAMRGRAAGHAMYLRPVFAEVWRPHIARVGVRVDGREVVADQRGMLVVANSRQYARRLDPARGADMGDGLLDVVFFPGRTTARMLLWAARCAAGDQLDALGAVSVRGGEVEVTAHGRTPWQCDGEAGGWLDAGQSVRLGVRPGALRVLAP